MVERCPGCGLRGLYPVTTGAGTSANRLCHRCGCCWHDDAHGWRRVDPRTCPGCLSREVCAGGLVARPVAR